MLSAQGQWANSALRSYLQSFGEGAACPSMRQLTPELLDHLPVDDPGAMRSRRDLRRINVFMGNEGWILSQIPQDTPSITEFGAGDGGLLKRIHHRHPGTPLAAIELMPRPADLPDCVDWLQADLLDAQPEAHGGTVIANLFLHHFSDAQLPVLGRRLSAYDTIIINEPLRARLPIMMGRIAKPFIHPITRHDMRVSIEAGFTAGELPRLLNLDESQFQVEESSTWRGSQRMLASCR